jgi:hypothetical protein
MKTLINLIHLHGYTTYASCCGHDVYPPTIVYKARDGTIREYFSGIELPKAKRHRYYRRDENGYYYIPQINEMIQQ